MKRIVLFVSVLFIGFFCFGQEQNHNINTDEGFIVFQGEKTIPSKGCRFSFAFNKGDNVRLKFSSYKEKKLKYVKLMDIYGKQIWQNTNLSSSDKVFTINTEGVYIFEFVAKGLSRRLVSLEIIRNSKQLYNSAWMKYNIISKEEIKYSIDSCIGYKPAIVKHKALKVFNKYLYQNIKLYDYRTQIKGNLAVDGKHAKGFEIIKYPKIIPHGAKLKCYTYSLNSVLGGKKHWEIANVAGKIGASAAGIFMSPAAGFALHGAMGLIGPMPGNDPVKCYMSNRYSDVKRVSDLKSNSTKAKKSVNKISSIGGLFGKIIDKGANAVGVDSGIERSIKNHLKFKTASESSLDFNQKGNITNLFVSSGKPPKANWFILTNSYLAHARNIHLQATAFYYAPSYRNINAEEKFYQLNTIPVEKSIIKYTGRIVFGSIKK